MPPKTIPTNILIGFGYKKGKIGHASCPIFTAPGVK
jgi:hypothetical protein